MATAALTRRLALLIGLLVLWNGAYFFAGNNQGSLARVDSVFAAVEPDNTGHRTLHIDRFMRSPARGVNTCDWSQNRQYNPHYYSNKAPATTWLAIPVYAGLYYGERALGWQPLNEHVSFLNSYVINLLLTALPGAVSALLFFYLILHFHHDARHALLMTLALYCATLMAPYSTIFYGHVTAAGGVVGGWYLAQRPGRWAALLSGTCWGLAVGSDHLAVVPLLVHLVGHIVARRWSKLPWITLGGVPWLVALILYNHWCFGTWLSSAIQLTNPIMHGPHDVLNMFSYAPFSRWWGLSFSPYRGAFWFMPILALAVWSWWWYVPPRRTAVMWEAAIVCVLLFLVNVGLTGWMGGGSFGPRYLSVGLPAAIVLLSYGRCCHDSAPRYVQILVWLVGLWSCANMAIGMIVSPNAGGIWDWPTGKPEVWGNPLATYARMLTDGNLHPWPSLPVRPTVSLPGNMPFNLGEWCGLPMQASLVPWLLGVLLLLWAMRRQVTALRRAGDPDSPP